MARVSVDINGERKIFPIAERGLRIGRALDNDIVLNHAFVSRYHAAVSQEGREVWVNDEHSRNGIFLNRLRVQRERLADGDIIRIGPFELTFEDRAAQSVLLDDSKYFPLNTEQREASDLAAPPELALDLREFYRISRRLNSILTLRELLDAVMEEVLRVVPGQRGLLLLRKGSDLVPMVVYPPTTEDVTISSTIARKALESNDAVLTRDARLDFAGAQSIISANIRSAVCAPLTSEDRALGLIYVDSPGQNRFGDQERDLLAAVANLAAINIERARLMERLRQQEQQRQVFERFLSPKVAQDVSSYFTEHGRLREPQELVATVLFADVKGFSRLSERLSPREVQDLLNEYLHEMTEVIFQKDGTLDKYIGDGIMALFGAPQFGQQNDAAQYARQYAIQSVEAALGMIDAHRRLVERQDQSKRFDFRIGINTGPVFAGFFGTRQRLEYTAIGDAVNTASRLESAAQPNNAFISEATYNLISDLYDAQEMGELELKGKQQKVRAFKLLGRKK